MKAQGWLSGLLGELAPTMHTQNKHDAAGALLHSSAHPPAHRRLPGSGVFGEMLMGLSGQEERDEARGMRRRGMGG